jgi:hypothetical protein
MSALVVSKSKLAIGGGEFSAWSLEVSKQMGIDGGEFSAAATLGMNKDPRSFGEEAIHPSSNPTMITWAESYTTVHANY